MPDGAARDARPSPLVLTDPVVPGAGRGVAGPRPGSGDPAAAGAGAGPKVPGVGGAPRREAEAAEAGTASPALSGTEGRTVAEAPARPAPARPAAPRGEAPGPTPPPAPQTGRPAPAPAGAELGAPVAAPRRRHLAAAVAFVLLVALPTAGAALYLAVWAADRYGSNTAFSVRSNEVTAPLEILGTVTQLGNSSAVIDGQILYDYIRSQQIVERVRRELPLEAMWNREPSDRWFSLGDGQPIEDLTEYWSDMVDVSLDPASGILTVEARAFRPAEAQAIAQAILDASADLVNRLTEEARTDAVAFSEVELAAAESRLRDIRARLRLFRDAEQEVDPSQNARVAIELVAGLEEALAEAEVQLDMLGSLSADAPRVRLLRRRIATLEGRIAAERTRLGSGPAGGAEGGRALASVVGDYEELVVDREFAEQAYTMALATYEQAQAEARRRQRYLAAHVSPTLAEEAQYPDRPLLVAAVFALGLAVWSILVLVAWNVRDRR